MRDLVLALSLGLVLVAPALAQQPTPAPNADQAASQLCDMNRAQGEKNAGAIIAANLKAIADQKAEIEGLKAEVEKLKKPATAK